MDPCIRLTHSQKCRDTSWQHHQTLLALWVGYNAIGWNGCFPLYPHGGSLATKEEPTQAWLMWESLGELRRNDIFWMCLGNLSLLISLHRTPHTAPITRSVWVGGEITHPCLTKWSQQKGTGGELGKKQRWPDCFIWAGYSVIILHSSSGTTLSQNPSMLLKFVAMRGVKHFKRII